MKLHADLTRTARVDAARLPWAASPSPGVDRRRIARVGDEVARVTSLVRYAPGSRFPSHTHGGGEEFLVLTGIFSDEQGDHPAGTWVRNGVGSSHSPRTDPGCVIFVKLWWMHPDEQESARVDTTDPNGWEPLGAGHRSRPLWNGPHDSTALHTLEEAQITLPSEGGLELFVVDGSVRVGDQQLERWSWLRRPDGGDVEVEADGSASLYVKTGHLHQPPPLPMGS